MATTKVWTQALEQNLIELWQQHECLYDVANEMYHNRAEKEKRWTEVASALQQPVEEVKTRAVSLRTQFVRLVKPKPSGSDNKPLTPRQRWLLRAMGFIKKYVSHRPCETTLCVSFSEQDDGEDRPDTPSTASTSNTASSLDSSDEGTSSTAVEETPLPVSTDTRNTQMESSTRRVKRKWRSETDIELQKLVFLKQIAAKGAADLTADAFTTFGNQVASELRLIQDPAYLTRLKRNIMNMIYDTQDTERNRSFSSHAPPASYTFQPVILSPVKLDECVCKEEKYETQITVKCENEEPVDYGYP